MQFKKPPHKSTLEKVDHMVISNIEQSPHWLNIGHVLAHYLTSYGHKSYAYIYTLVVGVIFAPKLHRQLPSFHHVDDLNEGNIRYGKVDSSINF